MISWKVKLNKWLKNEKRTTLRKGTSRKGKREETMALRRLLVALALFLLFTATKSLATSLAQRVAYFL